ncbi:MAG TPA: hypothetical protein VKM55_08945 [Candidatus Lokiarchaeia archaeon]|nr:hypothetical protein [Candidatus Lokiarchaeia archaeon]
MSEKDENVEIPMTPAEDKSLETVMKTTSTKRMVTGGVIYTVVDILGSIFFTIYNIMVAGLTPQQGEILTVVSTFQYMLKIFALLGFTGAGAKFIAEYLERDTSEARKYGISACKYNFFLFGLPIIMIAVVLFYFKSLAGDPVQTEAFFILIFLVTIDRLKTNADTYLLAYQRYDLYAVAWGVPYGAMYLVSSILIPFMGVAGPLLAWTLGEVAMFIWSVYYVKKISDFPARDLFAWNKEFNLFRKMFSFNFLYSLANLCFSLLTTTLLITLGDSIGILTPQEVQSLGLISTFSNILINVFGIVAGIQPAIAQAFALKNKKLVENYFLASVKFPVMMCIAVVTFFLVFGVEMISIFYSSRYVIIGLLIMAFLIPSYGFAAFANRYDNIIAGIGRPEIVIIPWFIGITISIVGIICTKFFIPMNDYLVNDIVLYKGTLVNYGITLSFTICLGSMALGLMLPGIWIILITLKVLGTKVPRGYVTRPAVAAAITAAILVIFKLIVPFEQLLENYLTVTIGGIVYTVLMVLVGVMLFLTFDVLLGGFTREDGRFWKSVVGSIPATSKLLSPIFAWGRFLLRHVAARFRDVDYTWITSTKKSDMEKDMEFAVSDNFGELYGDNIELGKQVEFMVQLTDIKTPLFHVVIYPKIDMHPIKTALVYAETINGDSSFVLKFELPPWIMPGHHELYIDIEAYTSAKKGITRETVRHRPWLARAFDFSYKWFDERIRYIAIE